ncbi:MAG: PIG-L family deacetylase [bacterium]|nr:PIG-L family deacetylase [bacterium]
MTTSCVIAAYNEERTVAWVVEAVRRTGEVAEIIVVSDGSTDATAEEAAASGADVVIQLPKNMGKGGAILAGARRASGEILLLLDADLENLKPAEIRALVQPVQQGRADMAVGVLAADLVQTVLPHLSGIRAVRRNALLDRPNLAGTRFGFERALTELAWRERWKIEKLPFTGVTHLRKEEKYGLIQGWHGKTRMLVEVLGLRGRRRNATPRQKTPLLALTCLTVVAAYLSMGLFSAPRAVGSALEVLPEPEQSDRVLIVAAHADDELLAAGGLIQRALAADAEVWMVFATNGDANRLAASLGGKRLLARPADFIAEGEVRQQEARRVMGRLGVPHGNTIFLGYPDRGLTALATHRRGTEKPYVSPFTKVSASPYRDTFRPRAGYTGTDLLRDLKAVIGQVRPTVILTHHEADKHGDHRAVNGFVREAIRSLEKKGALQRPRLYTFLVHAWDYPRPLRYAPDAALLPPKSLRDGYRWLRLDLQPEELALKHAALRDYRSQLDSPYLRLLLSSFLRQNELFAETEP